MDLASFALDLLIDEARNSAYTVKFSTIPTLRRKKSEDSTGTSQQVVISNQKFWVQENTPRRSEVKCTVTIQGVCTS
jgi:hypothetical protein